MPLNSRASFIRQRQFGCDSAYLHFGKLASSDHTNTATAVINDV